VEKGRRFRNVIILVVIIGICLATITISFRGDDITKRIKVRTLDIFEPVQGSIFYLFNPVTVFFSSIDDYIGLRKKYMELEKENVRLLQQSVEDISIKLENDALRKLMDMDLRQENDVLVVKVIGFYVNRWQSELIINAGMADGVQEGMGVKGDSGLVGVIISTGNSSASVRLISDPQISLGVRILSSRQLGLIEGSQEGVINLKYISGDEEVYKGDVVITSEYGEYIPSDILVGRVSSVQDVPGDLYRKITIEPFEDLRELEYLAVIKK